MDLFRARHLRDVRDGCLAHSPAGGEPERLTQHNAEMAYRRRSTRARCSTWRAPRIGRGRGCGRSTSSRKVTRRVSLGLEQIHVRGRQRRRPAPGRHRGEPDGEPVERADSRSGRSERARCEAVPGADRPGAGAAIRRSDRCSISRRAGPATGCGACRTDKALEDVERFGRRPAGAAGRFAGRTSGCRRAQEAPETAPGRSCRRTGLHPRRWRRRSTCEARRTGRRMAKWIVTGGSDAQGPGLFKIPVDGGAPVRLVEGPADQSGLVAGWKPDCLYAVRMSPAACTAPRRASRRDRGRPASRFMVRNEGERYRFLPDGKGLVYMQGFAPSGLLAARSRHEDDASAHPAGRPGRHAHVRRHARREADRLRPAARELGHRADRPAGFPFTDTSIDCAGTSADEFTHAICPRARRSSTRP